MKIPPDYKISPEILELITKIDANRIFLSSLKIAPQLQENLQRKSLLQSSLFSAKIEGNPLTVKDIQSPGETDKKKEVFNLLEAAHFLKRNLKPKDKITKKLFLDLHALVMKDLSLTGQMRQTPEAIYNQAGIAVYLAPPASEIPLLLDKLLEYINSSKERFPLIKAFISHLIFEKIHPFVDASGRVGRLLITAILKVNDYHFFGLAVPFEEYIEAHRSQYYHFLDIGLKETQEYLIFMLQAFYEQTEKLKKEIADLPEDMPLLLPRREEIYRIIKDHQLISFDFLRRRFLKVPPRTLRYDLKKLVDSGLVTKLGETSGSYYRISNNY
ncbi:MAG TPA: Fic family protein [Clostridia bacterium]|nr:Fic family protein [Clostridia bacterium]